MPRMTLRFDRPVSAAISSMLGQAVRVLLLRRLAILLPTDSALSRWRMERSSVNWSIQCCLNIWKSAAWRLSSDLDTSTSLSSYGRTPQSPLGEAPRIDYNGFASTDLTDLVAVLRTSPLQRSRFCRWAAVFFYADSQHRVRAGLVRRGVLYLRHDSDPRAPLLRHGRGEVEAGTAVLVGTAQGSAPRSMGLRRMAVTHG